RSPQAQPATGVGLNALVTPSRAPLYGLPFAATTPALLRFCPHFATNHGYSSAAKDLWRTGKPAIPPRLANRARHVRYPSSPPYGQPRSAARHGAAVGGNRAAGTGRHPRLIAVGLLCGPNGLQPVGDFQFPEHLRQVVLDRFHLDAKLLGDLLVG